MLQKSAQVFELISYQVKQCILYFQKAIAGDKGPSSLHSTVYIIGITYLFSMTITLAIVGFIS